MSRYAANVMAKGLPIVGVACLCEKVLTEEDHVISLIRVVDQFTVVVPPNLPDGFKPNAAFVFVLSLRAAGHTGKHEVTLEVHGPSQPNEPRTIPVEFPPGELSAFNLVMQMIVGIGTFGKCRIDVRFDGAPLTTVPFRLVQGQAQSDAVADSTQKKPK